MSEVSNIINSNIYGSFRTSSQVKKETDELLAKNDPSGAQRFTSQMEINEAGLAATREGFSQQLIFGKTYELITISASLREGQDARGVSEVEAAFNDLKNAIIAPNTDPVAASNIALEKIENILNRQRSNGEYIFGGKDSITAPCGDLVAASNIVNNKITTNYTRATANIQNIRLSELDIIQSGICASDKVFSATIGAINAIKSNSPNKMTLIAAATSELNLAAVRNLNNKNIIDQAIKNNKNTEKDTTLQMNSIFMVDIIESVGKLKDSITSCQYSLASDKMLNDANKQWLQAIS